MEEKGKVREFIGNLIFACGGTPPDHIIDEFMNKNKNKAPQVEKEIEKLTSVEEFNAEVESKLGTAEAKIITEEEFFSEIVGYADIKKLFVKCIMSDAMHVILDDHQHLQRVYS